MEHNLNLIFLAAGKGTRLLPLTKGTPKPILEIGEGQTILGRLLSQFSTNFNLNSIWINVSYLPGELVSYLSTISHHRNLNILWEPNLLGSACTFEEIRRKTNGDYLVVHSDLVLSDNYLVTLKRSLASRDASTVYCHLRQKSIARSVIEFSEGNLVTSISDKCTAANTPEYVWSNSGIYFIAKKDELSEVPAKGSDIVNTQLADLVFKGVLSAKLISDSRVSVDSIESLKLAKKLITYDKYQK